MVELSRELVDAAPYVSFGADTQDDGTNTWPERKPLYREVSPPEIFPIEALGNCLGGAVLTMSEILGAPDALCAQSILAAASLAAQAHADVIIDGRTYPTSTYHVTVAASGERKSAADNVALAAHREFQRCQIAKYELDQILFEQEAQVYEAAYRDAMKKKSIEEKRKDVSQLGMRPQKPVLPQLITAEPTYEGLVRMIQYGRPSVGLFTDEGGRFLGGPAMNPEHALKTLSGLSELWDGKEISRARGGDGIHVLYGKRLAMHIMIQPILAPGLIGSRLAIGQGFLSRSMVAWPSSTIGQRSYKEVNITNEPAIIIYTQRMRSLLERPVPLEGTSRNQLAPHAVHLDSNAKELWIAFHNAVESNQAEGKKFAPVRGFASKAAEHALRVAGLHAIIEGKAEIDLEIMMAALDVVNYFLGEALRLFGASCINEQLIEAGKLLKWLRSRGQRFISHVEIYQCGPSFCRTAQAATQLMEILSAHGECRPSNEVVMFGGRVRKQTWEIRAEGTC